MDFELCVFNGNPLPPAGKQKSASAQNCHHIGTDPSLFRKFMDSLSFSIKLSDSSTLKHFTKCKSHRGQNIGPGKAKTRLEP